MILKFIASIYHLKRLPSFAMTCHCLFLSCCLSFSFTYRWFVCILPYYLLTKLTAVSIDSNSNLVLSFQEMCVLLCSSAWKSSDQRACKTRQFQHSGGSMGWTTYGKWNHSSKIAIVIPTEELFSQPLFSFL